MILDQEQLECELNVVTKRVGDMVSDFGCKVHYHEYASQQEVTDAIAEIVSTAIGDTLRIVQRLLDKQKMRNENRFDA
jgi:predicted urease superfamily metal-dependent hydrolase